MDYEKQEPRSAKHHEQAEEDGLTCIDCHKGIAHNLPAEYDPEQDIPGKSIRLVPVDNSLIFINSMSRLRAKRTDSFCAQSGLSNLIIL